jgi:hypothetical protein
MSANKGISHDLEQEAKHLKNEQPLFWNSDETVPVWKEKKTCAKDMHDL